MQYLNVDFLRWIFKRNNIGTKALFLKNTNCVNTFSIRPVNENRKNQLCPQNIRFSWLSSPQSRRKKSQELISEIIKEIEAEPHFFTRVQDICEDLRLMFPLAKVALFGSAKTNLALTDADADIGIYLKAQRKVSKEAIRKFETKLKESRLFRRVRAIFASVPIIKCVHLNGVPCDISFYDQLATYDSELIRFVLSIDDRIRPLILILKFLLRREGLVANTHCLVVMTVFFLQGLHNPLVPPICYLQEVATEREMFEGWEVSFTGDLSKLPKSDNELSVVELVQKFFEFYSTFEFGYQVMSVFTGRCYLKPVFANVDSLPRQFRLYKEKVSEDESFRFNCSAHMCIQGFFNHNVNISRNVKNVTDFQNYCRSNAALGRELLQRNDSAEFLIKLFQRNELLPPHRKNNAPSLQTVFVMRNVSSYDDTHSSPDDIRTKWWNSVLDDVLEILRDVLFGKISVSSVGKSKDESSDVVMEKVISCEMPYRELATKLRKKALKSVSCDKNLPRIEREKIISDCVRKTLLENSQRNPYKLHLICQFSKNPTRVYLKFEPQFDNDKGEGLQTCVYLSKNIPKWLGQG